jgi:hypothetical protein
VKNPIYPVKERKDGIGVTYVLKGYRQLAIALKVLEVSGLAVREIIDDGNRMSLLQKQLYEVATNKSGSSGH